MIIVISKEGNVIQKNVKNYNNLYTICNYRNDTNFEMLYSWKNEYYLYGKKTGRSGYENSYKFPNINEQYYGTLCIIKKKGDDFNSLTLNEWENYCNNYDKPFIEPVIKFQNNKELTYEDYESE